MPTASKHPCAHPGCPVLVESGPRCAQHQRTTPTAQRVYDQTTRKIDPTLALAKSIRSSARWTRLSRLFKSQNPLCCDPFKEHGKFPSLTASVHHVVGIGKDESLAFEWSNLRPLCTACHNRVEGMERRGDDTASLFVDNQPPELSMVFA